MKRYAKMDLLIMIIFVSIIMTSGKKSVLAADIKLDVTEPIKGDKADYYITLPKSWQRYITVEREDLSNSVYELEKYNFYYNPYNTNKKQTFLMNLFVYHKVNWYESLNYKKVFENDRYVFALYSVKSNPYTGGTDKVLFNDFMRSAGDTLFIKDFLSFPGNQVKTQLNITVNNKMIESKAIHYNKDSIMVPIRDVCTELGYLVGWAEEGIITITRGSFYTAVSFDKEVNNRFEMVNQEGKVYISSVYFLERLNCSIEIDENNNVIITQKNT